jgi:acetoin utilization protein AcuC
MHPASARVVGATLVAAEAVLSGQAEHAFSPAGGMHHAMRDRAGGFCVYNDPAIAIAWMLEQGVERVAYVDVDVHHGDGVQAAFYDDPRVLTISIHESGRYLFPGTGAVREVGGPGAEGSAVNIPLPPETDGALWQHAFTTIVPPLVRNWRPEVLVTQLGCDTHATDPLAHLALSTNTYRETARLLHELAHDAAGGRWLATGGGGYQWATVVPRAWTTYFAEMAGVSLPDALPEAFRARAAATSGEPIPTTLSERVPDGPPDTTRATAVERVIANVRETIFPYHSLPTG